MELLVSRPAEVEEKGVAHVSPILRDVGTQTQSQPQNSVIPTGASIPHKRMESGVEGPSVYEGMKTCSALL
jgi:hypothetical protein